MSRLILYVAHNIIRGAAAMSTENFMYRPFSPHKSGSFGLGLAIAEETAEKPGGEISASGSAADGIVFQVTLCRQQQKRGFRLSESPFSIVQLRALRSKALHNSTTSFSTNPLKRGCCSLRAILRAAGSGSMPANRTETGGWQCWYRCRPASGSRDSAYRDAPRPDRPAGRGCCTSM